MNSEASGDDSARTDKPLASTEIDGEKRVPQNVAPTKIDGKKCISQDDAVDGTHNDGEQDEYIYPEGGLQAWLTVFGAWCALVGGLGLLNTISPLQTYIVEHQLRDYPQSTVSWIFSIYPFILFFSSIQIGPLFDAFGPRWLTLAGSACVVLSTMLLGQCTKYWHFVLDFSILSGLGGSLLLTPGIAAIGHFFNARRGFATGMAMTGPAMGGIIFPLVFRATFPLLGFSWATKILGFIMLILLTFANIFLRSRLPRQRVTIASILPDFTIFIDGTGALTFATAGVFFMELSLFIPIAYITSFCVTQGLGQSFSYQIVAILNAASVPGRFVPGFLADKAGRYNVMVATLLLCVVVNLCFWLPPSIVDTLSLSSIRALVIVFAVLFGFASGSNLGLVGPCVGQLCDTKDYGRYFATTYTIVSFATLIGIPIAGNLIDVASGYWGLIVFTSLGYGVSAACFAVVRFIKVGASPRAIF